MWMFPPESLIYDFVTHFEQYRKEACSTRAVILVPNSNKKSYGYLLKNLKYQLVHIYPVGSYLFYTTSDGIEKITAPPTTQTYQVWLADATIENRLSTQACNDNLRTVHLKHIDACAPHAWRTCRWTGEPERRWR